ncbi:hypothetical protein AAFF_G00414850, partial [Aldrovandia affinis]
MQNKNISNGETKGGDMEIELTDEDRTANKRESPDPAIKKQPYCNAVRFEEIIGQYLDKLIFHVKYIFVVKLDVLLIVFSDPSPFSQIPMGLLMITTGRNGQPRHDIFTVYKCTKTHLCHEKGGTFKQVGGEDSIKFFVEWLMRIIQEPSNLELVVDFVCDFVKSVKYKQSEMDFVCDFVK